MNILLTIVYWSDAAQMSHSLLMQIEWDNNYNQRASGQFSIRMRLRCRYAHKSAAVTTLRLNVLSSTEEWNYYSHLMNIIIVQQCLCRAIREYWDIGIYCEDEWNVFKYCYGWEIYLIMFTWLNFSWYLDMRSKNGK